MYTLLVVDDYMLHSDVQLAFEICFTIGLSMLEKRLQIAQGGLLGNHCRYIFSSRKLFEIRKPDIRLNVSPALAEMTAHLNAAF